MQDNANSDCFLRPRAGDVFQISRAGTHLLIRDIYGFSRVPARNAVEMLLRVFSLNLFNPNGRYRCPGSPDLHKEE